MATSTFPTSTGQTGVTEAAKFIPELWSNEIIAAYKKNLVMANAIKKMSFKGKKGDTFHIPKPARGFAAQDKAENTNVTIQNTTADELVISLNKHKEVSYFIEDIVKVQSLDGLRMSYTDDAGYAMARQVDDDLFLLGKSLGDGDGSAWAHSRSFQFNTSTGALEAYDADGTADIGNFSDVGFRRAIQYLDDADVPMDGRVFVIPPSLRNQLMGNSRYTEQAFVGETGSGNTIRNGEVGNLYGVPVIVTSNCPTLESGVKGAMLFHKDAFILAEQMSVRSQTQYKLEALATLFTSDMLYGTAVARPEAGVVLAAVA